MDDLAAWLTPILAEREDAAKRLGDRVWFVCNDGHLEEPLLKDETGEYERWEDGEYRLPNHHNTWLPALDPAAMLARIAADRQILTLHSRLSDYCNTCGGSWPCLTLCLFALPYADRPGYQEAWKPE